MGRAARCGGDRIDPELISLIAEHAARGTPCAVATVVRCEPPTSAHPGDTAVITADGRMRGWVGGSCSEPMVQREALRALQDGAPRLVRIQPGAPPEPQTTDTVTLQTTCPSGGALEIFVEPHLPAPLLAVIGASPVAAALVRLGAIAGFRTCAVHPGARAEDFPEAGLVLSSLDLMPAAPGPDTWVVVATMGHYDEEALEAALVHPDADVGLVASARRAAAVLEGLRRRGADEAAVARVRAPAGGRRAGAQAQIAVLVLAEVIGLREDRRRAARDRRPEPAAEPAAAHGCHCH
ncbi:MAG TPA: XdhC family protein [Candidatus Dormibacteraeota bacterium]|nr:XdhC family protein [Candidatus Dormibacteraeota bacterium]